MKKQLRNGLMSLLVGMIALALAGCGGGGDDTFVHANVEGTWHVDTQVAYDAVWTITQSNTSLVGTASIAGGYDAYLKGHVEGDQVFITITRVLSETETIRVDYGGTVFDDNNAMRGKGVDYQSAQQFDFLAERL